MKRHEKVLLGILFPIWILYIFAGSGPVKHVPYDSGAIEVHKTIVPPPIPPKGEELRDTTHYPPIDPHDLEMCDNF